MKAGRICGVGAVLGLFPAHLDPELASLALVGPIFYRRLLTASPLPASDIPSLMRQVLGPA